MKLIVAVDKDWGIGKDNHLLVHISEDLKFFKRMTTGHPVVMGRKTLESFPGGKPLPNRVNIVLTRNEDYTKEGAVIVHNLDELHKELAKYSEDVFVIGGDSVYKQLLDECDTAYVTKIHRCFLADTFFVNLDERVEWEVTETSEPQTQDNFTYEWVTYTRRRHRKQLNAHE